MALSSAEIVTFGPIVGSRRIGGCRTVTTGPLQKQRVGVERAAIGPDMTILAEPRDDRSKRPCIDADLGGKMHLRSPVDAGFTDEAPGAASADALRG